MTARLPPDADTTRGAGRQRPGRSNGPPRAHSVPAGVICLGVAREIVSVFRDLGATPARIITGAGLEPRLFGDGNNSIPIAALGRLVGLCVAQTSCPSFVLRIGEKASISALGLLGGLMQHSPTVRDVLRGLVGHFHLHDGRAAWRAEHDQGQAVGHAPGLGGG